MSEYIRYTKLTFTIEYLADAAVPAFKGSTIRGGLGDMLLAEHCIRDGNCRGCAFEEACLVPGIYYHRLKIPARSVQDGGSLGYTIECGDRRTQVHGGDRMEFSILLYGDVIVYFSVILNGLYRLGMTGIGHGRQAKFRIVRITDQDRTVIFDEGNVSPRAIHVRNLMEDAQRKAEKSSRDLKITFLTEWTQKWQNAFLDHFEVEAFAASVYRRVYLMHCMEGIPYPDRRDFDLAAVRVETLRERTLSETRYSGRQGAKIRLQGIRGTVLLESLPEDLLPYIYAGEITHIGKNTSIGFGRYVVADLDRS